MNSWIDSVSHARGCLCLFGSSGGVWAVLLGLVGCGAASTPAVEEGQDTGFGDSTSVQIHSGQYPYEPLVQGHTIPIEFGPQGGFHVLLAARVHGIEPGSPTLELGLQNNDLPMITWEVVAPDGMLSDEAPRRAIADPEDVDGTLLAPQLVVLRYYETPPPEFASILREQELQTLPITLNVHVEDFQGESASSTLEVKVDFPDRKGQIGG